MDWLDLLAVQRTLKSPSPKRQDKLSDIVCSKRDFEEQDVSFSESWCENASLAAVSKADQGGWGQE